jgi:hypothetical protein
MKWIAIIHCMNNKLNQTNGFNQTMRQSLHLEEFLNNNALMVRALYQNGCADYFIRE